MGDRKNIGNMTSEEIISIYEALQSGINVNQLCKLTGDAIPRSQGFGGALIP